MFFYFMRHVFVTTEFSSALKNRTVSAGEFEFILDAVH